MSCALYYYYHWGKKKTKSLVDGDIKLEPSHIILCYRLTFIFICLNKSCTAVDEGTQCSNNTAECKVSSAH